MPYRYAVLDVFTDTPLAGNPLAVVLDAGDLDTRRMQAIAREFNLSETVFVSAAENPAHSARLRIFTPAVELPFAGHPTIGTACLLAHERFEGAATPDDAMVVLEEEIGPVRCAVELNGEALAATFDVPRLPKDADIPIDPIAVARALDIDPGEIGFENHEPSLFAVGLPFLFVPVASLEVLAKARPDKARWLDAFPRGQMPTDAYVYCRSTERQASAYRARMFGPAAGIDEDPATGSAASAFAGVVQRFDGLDEHMRSIEIEQGFEMGRPSIIRVDMEAAEGELSAVRIGGAAVIVARGELLV